MLQLGRCRYVSFLLATMLWFVTAPVGADEPDDSPAEASAAESHVIKILHNLTAKSGARGEGPFVRDALLLGLHKADFGETVPQSLLMRELPRQALLAAARDELGLATRDATLREPFPEETAGETGAAEIASLVSGHPNALQLDVVVFRRTEGKIEVLFHRLIPIAGEAIESLAAVCEELSRTGFVDALKKAGYEGQPNKSDGPNTVSSTALKQSRDMSFIAQYTAIRRLHEAMRETGESSARLSLLARAYANLGSLTEYQLGSAHKVFKARALLYAERMVARTRGSPQALWVRAYVRAMIGRHQSALQDFVAAREKHVAAGGTSTEPAWAPAVEAYCRFDFPTLDKFAGSESLHRLACYLEFLAAGHANNRDIMMGPIKNVLQFHPGCLPAVAAMVQVDSLGPKRMAGSAAFQIMARSLEQQLKRIPGLPEAVRDLAPESDERDFAAQRSLLDALLAAGSLAQDRREPSLAALSRLAEDASVTHAMWQLSADKYQLAVSVEDQVANFEPLLQDHPLGEALRSFGWQRSEIVAASDAIRKSVIATDAQWSQLLLITHLGGSGITYQAWYSLCWYYDDDVAGDMLQEFSSVGDVDYRMASALRLKPVSPHSPMLVEARIRKEWTEVEPLAAEWERQYVDSPSILETLGNKYAELKRWDDAARLWKRRTELRSDVTSLQRLAEIYKSQGRTDEWLAVLQQALAQPAMGLEHARINVSVANHYMASDEPELALPYAEAAATSYSAWGMFCAVECHERLENWKEAETYIRRISERYEEGWAIEWFSWCARTGHGDLKAARKLAQTYYESLKTPVEPTTLLGIGMFYVLGDEPDKALEVYRAAFEQDGNPYGALHAAVIADSLQQPEARDELIRQAIQRGRTFLWEGAVRQEMVDAAVLLRKHFQSRAAAKDFDLAALNVLRAQAVFGEATNIDFFVGQILLHQGGDAEGRELLLRAATSPAAKSNRTMARVALRKLNMEVPRTRKAEVDLAELAKNLPDRAFVEWALGVGLPVTVGNGRREWTIGKTADLTDELFVVKALDARRYAAFNDEDLKRLTGLKCLRQFRCGGTQVTGRGLASLQNTPLLQTLEASSIDISDADLEIFGTFPSLQDLDLSADNGDGKLTDSALQALSGLLNLRSLNVRGHEITDAGLAHLTGLAELRSLDLGLEQRPLKNLTDAGLEHLADLANLESLIANHTAIADPGIEHLKGMTKLRHLSLANTSLTSAALSDLAKLTGLQNLNLDHCAIEDTGLEELSRLPALSHLSIRDTMVTDGGVDALLRLKKIKVLALDRAGISPAGLERLRAGLPGCEIQPPKSP